MSLLSKLGHFQIEKHLGRGSYTDTYKAIDTIRRRTVALKVLLPETARLAAFLDQAALASELVHPHIAWVWEVGEESRSYYLVERFIEGPSLAQVLAESGPIPWSQSYNIIQQLAKALEFAHARRWIHGDIQPGNILVSEELGAVLSDFGLTQARRAGNARASISILSAPAYTPPEVWVGEKAGTAADQYAVACVLVELLTGKALFAERTRVETRARQMAPLKLPDVYPPGVPRELNTILARALSKDSTQRYPGIEDFAGAISDLPEESDPGLSASAPHIAWVSEWQEAQEQERLQFEEEQRLAALEQARHEIELELQRQAPLVEEKALTELPSSEPLTPAIRVESRVGDVTARKEPPLRRRPVRRQLSGSGYAIGFLLIILVIALVGLWLDQSISGGIFPATATPTQPTSTVTSTSTITRTATSTPTATGTHTPTPTNTATFTHTPTSTSTGTPTPTPTITDTPTRTLVPTRTPTSALEVF